MLEPATSALHWKHTDGYFNIVSEVQLTVHILYSVEDNCSSILSSSLRTTVLVHYPVV